jgi:uncharacterized protein
MNTSTTEHYRALFTPIFKKYGVKSAALFGSAARGELRKDSDIDLLVEFGESIDLIDFQFFTEELESKAGRHVDVVTPHGIPSQLRAHITPEIVSFYVR